MDGFLGQWSAISYKPSIGSGVMDMTPLMQGGNAGGSMRPSALGQSMGSTVIPAVGPASDAALRAASQQGFRPGAYERMPAPETAQNQNGPALCQFSFGQHARSWGDKSPYPMPRQFELLFGHIPRTNGPRYGEEGLDWSYLAPLDGGLSVGLHDGISGVRSRNGAAIGLTALNAQFTWSYMSRLLKARRGTPAEYERFIEEDQLETLSELWQSYRCLGVVFSQAEKDDAYLALRRAGISAIPNYYLTANYVRGGRVQVIDYSNGSGMINGAAIYLVLRYMPMTKDTMYSFLPELDEMGGGRYQAEATWFTDDAVETYYVPQMCWEARPQNGLFPTDFASSTVVYPPAMGAVGVPVAKTVVNHMGQWMKLGTLEERSVQDAKGDWRYQLANENAVEMVTPTSLYDLYKDRKPVEIIMNMTYY